MDPEGAAAVSSEASRGYAGFRLLWRAASIHGQNKGYRADVDGLRAIAVLAVVFYHFRIWPFGGGYVGVDVFFVISGFLITSLVYGEMEREQCSLVRFYERRVRRILPALLAMIAIVTIISCIVPFPDDLLKYSRSLLAMPLFSSNFQFWSEAGYFDVAAEQKPLLHTWSLAVEEQFYILFPTCLLLIRNWSRQRAAAAVAAAAAISFLLSIWAIRRAPAAAFYLSPPRFWELLLGSILALSRWRAPQGTIVPSALGAVGLGLIAYAVFFFDRNTVFPGTAAVIPCLGTAAAIYAGTSAHSVPNRFLSVQPVVFLGLISYSLYLWHWPILVFANYYSLEPLSIVQKAGLISLALALACLSWRFVELPFRSRPPLFSRTELFRNAAMALAATAAMAMVVLDFGGFPLRFTPEVRTALAGAHDLHPAIHCMRDQNPNLPAVCRIGEARVQTPDFLLWGDSEADALRPAIEQVAMREHRAGWFIEHDGCGTLLGVERSDVSGCRSFNDAGLAFALKPAIREVILASRWAIEAEGTRYGRESGSNAVLTDSLSHTDAPPDNHAIFERALESVVRDLRAAGKAVVLVQSPPEIGIPVPEALAKTELLGSHFEIAPLREDYLKRQEFVRSVVTGLRRQYAIAVVDPHVVLCATVRCEVEIEGRPLYRDDHHLNVLGSEQLVPLFASTM